MDKIKIGIPRSLYYYYFKDLYINFFNYLNCDVIISPETNKEIMDLGNNYSNDEMCLSLKNYIGHIVYLKDKVDYILIPRIDNYGISNQTCTNFLSLYDIVSNLIDTKILNYNISLTNNENEYKGFIKIGKQLNKKRKEIKYAYLRSKIEESNKKDRIIRNNMHNLLSKKIKILIVGHPYNIYDALIGKPIINYLEKNNIEIIYCDQFDEVKTNKLSSNLSSECYFKYNKENIGSLELCKGMIDGVIFLTSFPCGPDSLVNELVMRKINIPYLNLIIDDLDSNVGIITRLESFIDVLRMRRR